MFGIKVKVSEIDIYKEWEFLTKGMMECMQQHSFRSPTMIKKKRSELLNPDGTLEFRNDRENECMHLRSSHRSISCPSRKSSSVLLSHSIAAVIPSATAAPAINEF